MADQPQPRRTARVHAPEQVGRGGLPAGKQDGVGRNLLVDVAFARAARPQFAQVVVALHQRHHALDEMHALALGQHAGLVARRAQQHVKPFVAREVLALLNHGLQVKVRHLDGREAGHRKRRVLRPALLSDGALLGPLVAEHFHAEIVFVKVHPAVFNAHDAPNAPLQDLGVVAHVIGRHHERLDVQVREMRLVDVLVLVKHGRHLVDDGVLPQLADLRLDALAFVGAHVVVREDGANAVKAGRQVFLVVGGAIHPQQVFQHERGHVRPALHERRQVLAHDFAAEVL